MKPRLEECPDSRAGVTRRQAIQQIGGGLFAAVVVPGSLLSPPHSDPEVAHGFDPSPAAASIPPLTPMVRTGLARSQHTMTPLPDGRLFIVGGESGTPLSKVEFLDPVSGTWQSAASLRVARFGHATALLPDGRILVVGGTSEGPLTGAEVYDPSANRWTPAASLHVPRTGHVAATLPNGFVVVTGGRFQQPLSSVEVYDPTRDRWTLL